MKTKSLAKNRTLIGIVCIMLAVLITFVLMPVFNNMLSAKTKIVRFKQDVTRGSLITSDMLEDVTVGKYNLPGNIITESSDAIGKYAESDFFNGDYVLSTKVASELKTAEQIITGLDGKKLAMSISLKTFANGVSGKLKGGDIVSVIVVNEDAEIGEIPEELKYVKVVTSTTAKGLDTDDINKMLDSDGENLPATVTLLVNDYQAEMLAQYEKAGVIHIALVCRGDNSIVSNLLQEQDKFLQSEVTKNE